MLEGPRRGWLLAVCLALTWAGLAVARTHAPAGGDSTAVMTVTVPESLLGQLLLLADDACDVRYVPGTLDRAAHVETWLRGLATGAAKRTHHPLRLAALVLGREEWVQAGLSCPYGIPCRAGNRVVALPAAGDAGTVALWRGLLGGLPQLAGVPFLGTAEEAASLVPADSLAPLVAARDLVTAAGLVGDEPWVTDVLAHALSLDAARHAEEGRAEDLVGFWNAVQVRFGPQGVAPTDAVAVELRRQAKLFNAAQSLLGSSGKLPLKTLLKMQEKGGGVLRSADLREWSSAMSEASAEAGGGRR